MIFHRDQSPNNAYGNFIIGPTHPAAPETLVNESVPQGQVIEFTMESKDSKIYPGIARDPGTFGTPDPNNPAKLDVTTSAPAPFRAPRRLPRRTPSSSHCRRATTRSSASVA